MMVARVTLTICAAIITLAAANIEFKHHNNTELAAILQQVRLVKNRESFIQFLVESVLMGERHITTSNSC